MFCFRCFNNISGKKTNLYPRNSKDSCKRNKGKKFTFCQAAAKYNIPKATLFDQVRKDNVTNPKRGKKSVFNETQKKELVQFIVKSCKMFYGITVLPLRKIAFDFANANSLKHKDTGSRNGLVLRFYG